MKQAKILSTPRSEVAQEDSNMEATKSVHLRLLMKEREDAVNGLVPLDYSIWVLQEFFRGGNFVKRFLNSSGTPVPKRSLSSHKRNPSP